MQYAQHPASEYECVSPLSILIVDDSESERALIRYTLENLNHNIIEVSNGQDALKIIAKSKGSIDLILLDVLMPIQDGYKIATKIRCHEEKCNDEWCPIIFLSGKNNPADIARGIYSGGDDYLVKPVNSVILKAKIIAMQRIAMMRRRLIETREQLRILAHTDELTRIPNRRKINEIIDSEIARSNRNLIPFTVAILDLDHFKNINDTYGHKAGDLVLQSICLVLKKTLRAEDSIGRIGGEEFCICLPSSCNEPLKDPFERFRQAIENSHVLFDGKRLSITASFGITLFQPKNDTPASVLERADKALYIAKNQGRNRVEIL